MVTIKQDETDPVPAEVIAQSIIKIDDSMKRLLASGLKRHAIVALVHDSCKVTKTQIILVLNALDGLRKEYCSK